MASISFVIPCYASAKTIGTVVEEIIIEVENKYNYEIILINDCSPDNTFDVITSLCEKNDKIVGINLAKNFGQHAALMAGYRQAKGDLVVCLDDDGQTPPSEVGKLLQGIEDGYDVVYAKYTSKKHKWYRNIGSTINKKMTEIMLEKPKDLYVSSYFVMKRYVVDEIVKYGNAYPYVIGLVLRTTKNITNVEIKHKEREVGESGYSLKKLFALWINGFTAFSVKPLRIANLIGVVTAASGFLYASSVLVRKVFFDSDMLLGWSSLISVVLFIGGIMMCILGIIGEYVGRIYISLNNAPQYVIREIIKNKVGMDEIKHE